MDKLNIFTKEGAKFIILTFVCSFFVGVAVGVFGLLMVIDALAKAH